MKLSVSIISAVALLGAYTITHSAPNISGEQEPDPISKPRSFTVPPDPERGYITSPFNQNIGSLLVDPNQEMGEITINDTPNLNFSRGFNESATNLVDFFIDKPGVAEFTLDDTRAVREIEVTLTVRELWFTDDSIVLIAPGGREFILTSGVAGTSIGTTINGEIQSSTVTFTSNPRRAKTPILTNRSPVNGNFLPETALNNLNFSAQGEWKLIIKTRISETGQLSSYRIKIKVQGKKNQGFGFTK
ncbi:hypothetical protein QPK87_38065 [Kamptonema cortianum]|nr:hypothetical protein [Kamptonema cortianum]MDL5049723.1 hypothetical protein [Oscillatoria amoena NRMC-F 0135]